MTITSKEVGRVSPERKRIKPRNARTSVPKKGTTVPERRNESIVGMTITLSGEPLSTNHIYKYHCQFGAARGYMSKEGKALKEQYQWEARSQYHGKPLPCALKLTATLFFGRRRRRDADNYSKLAQDALNGIVYEDDSQIEELRIVKAYDKANPRIVLEIEALTQ